MSIQEIIGTIPRKQGDHGDAIQVIQFALRDLGYQLKGTGFFGGATDAAVTDFQKKAGLKADGIVGPATGKALDFALERKIAPGDKKVLAADPRPLWLTYGLTLIGTQEYLGARDNATIIDWAKEEGGSIAKAYTHDSIPWCALFANHILTKVGIKGTETLWALDFAGKWPSVQLNGPAVGAFAPMLRDGGGHIICIAGRNAAGQIMGLGGNQHDAVNIAAFPLARLNKGFWWPAGVPLPRTGMDALPIITGAGLSAHEA